MNKIAIPALLVATVMVAGAFTFMPVEQASTVHLSGTTTIAAGGISAAAVGTGALDADALAADAVVEIQTPLIDAFAFAAGVNSSCTSDAPFLVYYNVSNLADAATLTIAGTAGHALIYTADVGVAEANQNLTGTLGGGPGETITFAISAGGTSSMTVVSAFGSTGNCA